MEKILRHFMRLPKAIGHTLGHRPILDFGDYKKTVFVAGTGRSGTTWLQEIINWNNDFRVMFEPFHTRKVRPLQEWNYRQYLREDELDDLFLKPAKSILSGNIRSKWIDQFNQRLFVRQRLIKDIRAQLILKWIRVQFPEMPIILLLRHPCAVARSKIELGWDTHLEDFLAQENLMQDYLSPFEQVLIDTKDSFEKHILMWCVENFIPLKQFKAGEVLVVFYENLCTNPQDEVPKIMHYIKAPFTEEIFQRINKPSRQSRTPEPHLQPRMIDAWKEFITSQQIEKTIEILRLFGLDNIYQQNSMPLVAQNEIFALTR